MTCIVGLIHQGQVWVGGDSLVSDGDYCFHRKDPKVFSVGEMLVGYAGSIRAGQLCRFSLKPPKFKKNASQEDILKCLVKSFVPSLQETFQAKQDERSWSLIIGVRQHIFQIEDDFQVGVPAYPYAATGSGDLAAWGALHATEGLGLEAEDRITRALGAAAEFNPYVRGPYTIKRVGKKG